MAYAAKATAKKSYRRNTKIAVITLALLGAAAFAMMIYSLINGKILFSVGCLLAMILCFSYVVIRSNSVFPIYLAADKRNLYMKIWTNGFLPYNIDVKPSILSEFIPAPTKIIEIPIDDISTVLIGTKNFIKR
jgi:hypothetical protein